MTMRSSIDKKKYNSNKEGKIAWYTQAVKAGNTIYISGIAVKALK